MGETVDHPPVYRDEQPFSCSCFPAWACSWAVSCPPRASGPAWAAGWPGRSWVDDWEHEEVGFTIDAIKRHRNVEYDQDKPSAFGLEASEAESLRDFMRSPAPETGRELARWLQDYGVPRDFSARWIRLQGGGLVASWSRNFHSTRGPVSVCVADGGQVEYATGSRYLGSKGRWSRAGGTVSDDGSWKSVDSDGVGRAEGTWPRRKAMFAVVVDGQGARVEGDEIRDGDKYAVAFDRVEQYIRDAAAGTRPGGRDSPSLRVNSSIVRRSIMVFSLHYFLYLRVNYARIRVI